jgi:hypothetical protein
MHPKHREVSKSDKSIELLILNRSSESDYQRNSGSYYRISEYRKLPAIASRSFSHAKQDKASNLSWNQME